MAWHGVAWRAKGVHMCLLERSAGGVRHAMTRSSFTNQSAALENVPTRVMAFTTALRCAHQPSAAAGDAQPCSRCLDSPVGTSIFTAADYGRADLVQACLQRTSAANATDAGGYTPLHYAAQRNHVGVVELLIERGADVNANACGATPLHRAAHHGSYACCKLLLDHGADPRRIDTSFSTALPTALAKALAQGHLDVVALLQQATRPGLAEGLDL
jgi:hypothetical protein